MANIRIATDIYTNPNSSVEASSYRNGAVAERVLTPPNTLAWEAFSAANATLTGDWGSNKPVNFACLFGIEYVLTGTSTIKLELSIVSDFATTVYERTIGNADIYGQAGVFPLLAHFWLPSTVNARYWRLTFTGSGQPTDYIGCGRVVIGRYWAPEVNMDTGYQIGFSDRSDIQYTAANIMRVLAKAKARTMAFQLSHLGQTDTLELMKLVVQKEVFISAYPEIGIGGTAEQQEQEQQHTIVGAIQQNVQVAQAHGRRRITNIQATEDGTVGNTPGDSMSAVWLRVDRNLADLQDAKTARDNLRIGDDFSRDNFIDNSMLDHWQRSTNVSGQTSGGVVAADRFFMQFTQAGSETYSVEKGPKYQLGTENRGYFNSVRLNTTADHGGFNVQQRMEEYWLDRSSGNLITLSFWAKSWNPITLDRISVLVRLFNGGIGDFEMNFSPSTFSTTAALKKYVCVMQMPEVALARGNKPQLRLNIGTTSSQPTRWEDLDITAVKLELGDQATRFAPKDPESELARCQRYHLVGDNSTNLRPSLFSGQVSTGRSYKSNVIFPVQMYDAPDIILTNVANTSFPATTGTVVSGVGGFTEERTANLTADGEFISSWTASNGI